MLPPPWVNEEFLHPHQDRAAGPARVDINVNGLLVPPSGGEGWRRYLSSTSSIAVTSTPDPSIGTARIL